MFFLSHATLLLLLASFMLVFVMFAGLLEVILVVSACGAILLTYFVTDLINGLVDLLSLETRAVWNA